MSAQPEHSGGELIPRPDRTPDALREALAVVAPARMPEMEREKDKALAEAVRQSSIDPLRGFLLRWAVVIEIERHPATAQRFHRAEYLAQVSADPETSRRHVRESGDILRAVYGELDS
ncbi:hypothetical protein OG204_15800 [Streptomyces sp. NBC_01387]|uniref:DUF6247 family protein n=1 Tax=unclassified Streptomyces TaxID=2593676 RepID=UPI0020256636|nr:MULTISPECIES: DUF6247 family protein [unclassified Streptomyces]MCX4550162.1 hypothetical protein [Streptomyces sp. NBC_01500]WSC21662.1 hypothetical protein OIE60_19360 [Streptomyces sp. NBC_01766]WSV55620.1 hypothetical protein OG282_19035 [Streptomyces sp. NBC_01014]